MKKIYNIAFTLFVVASLSSCKKGEHDPFLSLKTRKARLCGEWTLSNYTYNAVENQGNSSVKTTNSTYNGTTETSTATTSNNGNSVTATADPVAYQKTLTIKKDGTFEESTVYADGSKEISSGNWLFLGKNKSEKIKKKESVEFNYTNLTSIDANGTTAVDSGTGFGLDTETYLIDELKSKEIILKNDNTYTGNNGKTDTYSTSYTYKAK